MHEVKLLDLHAEFNLFESEVRAAVDRVLESQQFINGPAVAELEQALAERIGVKHAIAVSSGTDALLCALMAVGVGPGDEVIVPSFTFFATAGVVWRVGAKPVFVDVDPRTFNLDPRTAARAITSRTKAIIPVHLFGQCAEMDEINAMGERHGLTVIEDAAQAIGARYKGRQAGTLGRLACLSFYPTKNLGGFGEGGMITTDDDALARRCRQLRHHGETERYVHEFVGGNFRLDTLKAAILLAKLPYLDELNRRRRRHAQGYDERLAGWPLTTPFVPEGQEPVYHQYTILCDRRDDLRSFLADRGVATGVYYPVPLHGQKCFAPLGCRGGDCPIAERLCDAVLSLPVHPMLREEDVNHVADSVREFFERRSGSGVEKAARFSPVSGDWNREPNRFR